MPIAKLKPSTTTTEPEIPKEQLQTTSDIVSTSNPNFNTLIPYVEGSTWKVDYFHQNVSKDQILEQYDPKVPDVLQTFTLFKDLILRVIDPLPVSPGTDENNPSNITGSSMYINTVTPYIGDMFAATLPDNSIAIFSITNVERKTFYNKSVYQITYILAYLLDSIEDTIFKDIESKTNKVFIYDEANFKSNRSPLLTVKDHDTKKILKSLRKDIIHYYNDYMVDRVSKLLLVPHTEYKIYDPYLVSYFFNLVDMQDDNRLLDIRRIDFIHPIRNHPLLYRALLERDSKILDYCYRKVIPYYSRYIGDIAEARVVYYLGIGYIMLPQEHDTIPFIKLTESISLVPVPNPNNKIPKIIESIPVIDQIPNITDLDTYVFSNGFYNKENNLKLIETMVLNMINNRHIDPDKLIGLCENSFVWGRLEQFYYMPILLHLIKYYMGYQTSTL